MRLFAPTRLAVALVGLSAFAVGQSAPPDIGNSTVEPDRQNPDADRQVPATEPQAAPRGTATEPTSPSTEGVIVHPSGAFKFRPPAGWRQLTIAEARQLAREHPGEFPSDIVDWQNLQPAYLPFGAVDQWLANGFDGACLLNYMIDGEVSLDPEEGSRQQILDNATVVGARPGVVREILALDEVELSSGQRGFVAKGRLRMAPDEPLYQTLEYYLPTSGSTLLLVFRGPEAEFAAREPEFRQAAETVVLARPPRGKSGLGGRLLEALLYGSLIGALLVFLYQRTRGGRSPSEAGTPPAP